MSAETTSPVNSRTVTVLGSHWKDGPLWSGFDFSRAELRSGSIWSNEDYHLGVPWIHPDDIGPGGERHPDYEGIYRLRLKRGWRSFVQVNGEWRVSKNHPAAEAPFGTPPHRQVTIIEIKP